MDGRESHIHREGGGRGERGFGEGIVEGEGRLGMGSPHASYRV